MSARTRRRKPRSRSSDHRVSLAYWIPKIEAMVEANMVRPLPPGAVGEFSRETIKRAPELPMLHGLLRNLKALQAEPNPDPDRLGGLALLVGAAAERCRLEAFARTGRKTVRGASGGGVGRARARAGPIEVRRDAVEAGVKGLPRPLQGEALSDALRRLSRRLGFSTATIRRDLKERGIPVARARHVKR